MSRSVAPVPGAPHGTRAGYVNWGCGCFECKAANAAYARDFRARRAAAIAEDPTLAEHGTDSTYCNWGCRCQPCTRAHTEAQRQRRNAA